VRLQPAWCTSATSLVCVSNQPGVRLQLTWSASATSLVCVYNWPGVRLQPAWCASATSLVCAYNCGLVCVCNQPGVRLQLWPGLRLQWTGVSAFGTKAAAAHTCAYTCTRERMAPVHRSAYSVPHTHKHAHFTNPHIHSRPSDRQLPLTHKRNERDTGMQACARLRPAALMTHQAEWTTRLTHTGVLKAAKPMHQGTEQPSAHQL